MKRISLLVYEDAVLSALSGALDILVTTNHLVDESRGRAPFRIGLVSEEKKQIELHQPARFICERTLEEVSDTDLIVAPAFNGSPERVLEKNRTLVEWISAMYRQGTEVASLCYGSYFLAEAGLLDGKPCTSHWRTVEHMQRQYPKAEVRPDAVITDKDGIYTSGGAFSSLNLVLYLIEKFCGREVAVQVSKLFSVDLGRVSQAHFAVFQGQRDHNDEQILEAQTYIEERYDDDISIADVADQVPMSRRNFVRRFKKATGNTPLEYLQRVRVEAAKKDLETTAKNVGTLMHEVGYSDAKTFRKVFRRHTGLTPQAYRNKYNRA